MKTRRMMDGWRFGLMLALLCLCSIPQLAGAVPAIPTGPHDAVNGTPDYYTTANWANSPPLAKFVDTLPASRPARPTNLGQYLSVGKPDIVTYPGSDYYEIDLVEYRQRMHSDLPLTIGPTTGSTTGPCCAAMSRSTTGPTSLQAIQHPGPDPVHYLGPIIVAQRDRPVRIKFTNRLPTGDAGDLFIPVDTSVMGAGVGPADWHSRGEWHPATAPCEPNSCAMYTQNRSDIHLHGGRTPWISDGTPHQWITPAEEITPFTKGVSLLQRPGHARSGRRLHDLLLHQPAERPPDVLP